MFRRKVGFEQQTIWLNKIENTGAHVEHLHVAYHGFLRLFSHLRDTQARGDKQARRFALRIQETLKLSSLDYN